jgi:hypothetical protein
LTGGPARDYYARHPRLRRERSQPGEVFTFGFEFKCSFAEHGQFLVRYVFQEIQMRLSRTIAGKSFLANPLCRFASIAAVLGVILVSASVFFIGRTSTSGGNAAAVARARLGDSVTTEAKGRGKPWINMTDGHELVTSYKGSNELVGVLARDQARPLSLASGDFDEDGMPDLVTGYAVAGAGLVTLQRGNVDSVYPYTPEAKQRRANGDFTDTPFLSPAAVFDTAAVPEILLQGDFNADGHADLITGVLGSEEIYLLAGDGRGNLAPARGISLPGRVTALTSGEINRADGLTDLVVAIDAADGPKLMVFEGPDGAVKATPELLSLPSAATDLVLGYVGADHFADVAVAAGNELLIVQGRDRKLSLDEKTKAAVPQARISHRSFPSSVISLAIGDFTGGPDLDLAVMLDDGSVQLISAVGGVAQSLSSRLHSKAITLAAGLRTRGGNLFCARVSSLSHENLVMVDRESNQLHVWMDDEERRARGDAGLELSSRQPSPPVTFDTESEPAAVLPMRLNTDALSDLVVLRADRMSPSVMLSQPNLIIVVCTTLDCTECPNGDVSLRNAIGFANGSPGLDTIRFRDSFSGIPTINLQSSLPSISEAIVIDGAAPGSCSLGEPDVSPQSAGGIGLDGGNFVNSGFSVTGGGIRIADFVIGRFTGNGLQVTTNAGNIVEGNFIGLASDGSTPRPNGTGVRITSRNNTIGGTVSAASNVISGNNGTGLVFDGVNATDNQVRNNAIGTTANGQFTRGNSQFGVAITNGATRNIIGGSFVGTANDIFGSGLDGVLVSASGNTVQRNDIGLNNRNGVSIASGAGNLIGGTNDIVRNNIISNSNNGLEMSGGLATDNVVQGNFIGYGVSTPDQGNTANGVSITSSGSRNAIGGGSQAAGNLIAFNSANGVLVDSGNQNLILSNRIVNNVGLPIRLSPGANGNQAPPTLVAARFNGSGANQPTVAVTLSVTVRFTGTPGQIYTLDFVLKSACDCRGKNCEGFLPMPLGQQNIGPIDNSGVANATYSFPLDPAPNPALGFVNATAVASNNNTSEYSQCLQIGASSTPGLQYYPLPSPVRLLDTRPGEPACNNPGAALTGGAVRTQVAIGACSGSTIPANARAIVGNATVVNTGVGAGSGFVTLYPSGAARPTVSNLNYVAGQVVPNAFTVGLGSDGAFNIFPQTTTHFIVDITGYYAPPAAGGIFYHPLPSPVRLLDTRPGEPACITPGAALTGGAVRTQPAISGCTGIPASARAIVGNATVVNTGGGAGSGFITLYPSGATRPTVSNLNYIPGQVVPNAFTVGLGSDGAFNIFAQTTTHFIVDINGYFSDQAVDVNGAGLQYYPLPSPVRLLDTRPGEPACITPGAALTGGAVRTQPAISGCTGIPGSARAIVGNATVVNTGGGAGSGFITLYPSGATRPNVSNLNYIPGQVVPNAFTVGLGSDGAFNIFAQTTTHFIVDIAGYFAP